jgi:hypothetical protein
LHVPDALYLARAALHGLDPAYVVTGVERAVRAGTDLNWDHVVELVKVLYTFSEETSTKLEPAAWVRLLQILYAATVASRRVDASVVRSVLADAA